MNIDSAIDGIFSFGSKLLDKFWPDADAADKRKYQQFMTELMAQVQLAMGQLEVNKAEAEHKSIFVAGWRPGVGWICVAGLAYQFVIYPFLTWGWSLLLAFDCIPTTATYPPELNTGILVTLVTGMLGLGAVRTVERIKGVATNSIGQS